MNRMCASAIVVLLIVAALLFAMLSSGLSKQPETVASMAAQYATYLSATGTQPVTVQRVVRAARPDQFRREMSKATFSNSLFYNITYDLQKTAESGRRVAGVSNARAMPYPPDELWCVLLSDSSVVVVGRHHDLFNAEWVLHEVVGRQATQEQVGCNPGATAAVPRFGIPTSP